MSKGFNVIACVNKKLTLGDKGKLIYRIKDDLTNFKRLTQDNIVIMGKSTFESLPNNKPLPNRINIIITHDPNYQVEGAIVVHSILEAIEVCENPFLKNKERFIIGGGCIYKQFLDACLINKLYLTEVDDYTEGDTIFPMINEENWKVQFQTEWIVDDNTKLKYRYKFLINTKK